VSLLRPPLFIFQDCGLAEQKGFIAEARQRRSRIIERCALVQAAHIGWI
jgi:hypothetical protein